MPVRVGFVSHDHTLKSILVSVLGTEVLLLHTEEPQLARELVSENKVDALIFDIDLYSPRPNGESAFQMVVGCGAPVIVLAGDERRREALDLVEHGAYGYVRKPPVLRELRAMLRRAFEGTLLKGELLTARRQLESSTGLDQLTGSSAPMQLVYKLVRKVANLDATVLVTGESGTGKELIARAIHNTGNRSKRPFVAVACGAIPEGLIEAELFGHEKGAFTGSVGVREGYFEKAGDGTLFLDEIGELNPGIQAKLLRVLQEREFSRLGSSRTIPLRARIVFATHRDLEQMVADGTFRQDLFYRINVMNIVSPALHEHKEDVPQLVHHFFRQYSELYRKPVENIEPEALALLQQYSWPGNVRELENVVQRAIIMAEGFSIEPGDLPKSIRQQDLPEFECDLPAGSFERMLRDFKFKLASDAVQQCNGNKTLAAQSLCISRAYLHRLLRQAPGADSNVAEFGPRRRDADLAAALPLVSGE